MKGKFEKMILLVISMLAFSLLLNSQGVWEIQNPLPTSEHLEDIYCLPNTNIAWAVGANGTILKTVDGIKWFRLNSGSTSHFTSVFFADANEGWTVGRDGTVLKTSNGGYSWTQQTSGVTNPLRRVQFLDKNTGWAMGDFTYEYKSTIIKTENGGNTWTAMTISGYDIWDFCFVNSLVGWGVGEAGAIIKTTDGGDSWIPESSGTAYTFYGVFFTDINNGWAIGNGIYKTSNGGTTWVRQSTTGGMGIYMINSNVGWAVGNGTIQKTSNGGVTWSLVSMPGSNLYGVRFSDTNTGWAVGTSGIIIRTINGGANWTTLTSGTFLELRCLSFVDSNTGFAAGGNYDASGAGIILKTSNGGNTWTPDVSNYSYGFSGIDFLNANYGIVAGENGTILKTTNGGESWTLAPRITTTTLLDVSFVTETHAWVVGYNGVILKSTDGGSTWAAQSSGTTEPLYDSYFIDINNGYICTYGGKVLKTTNGGINWTSYNAGGVRLNSIFFSNNSTGWVAGNGTIRKTTNGGLTWEYQATGNPDQFNGIYFADLNNGWAVGSYGKIYRTSNGGSTWSPEVSGTSSHLNTVHFLDYKNGWATGASGAIIHYTNYSPSTQATNLSLNDISSQGMGIGWSRGNGNQCALFVKEGVSTDNCIPEVNMTYLPNSRFGSGDQIGNSGWYCVYNGAGTSVNVTGLHPSTTYRFKVCEYNFSPDFVHYNINSATNNPVTGITKISPPSQIIISPVNRTVCEPGSTSFTVSSLGTDLIYRWQVDQGSGYINIIDDGYYSGSTSTTLVLTGCPASFNGYKYHCIVSNVSGSATSGEALLTVNPLPVNPTNISGDTIVCLNNSYNYSVSPVSYATTYTWTLPSGFSGTSSTNTISIQAGQGASTGTITVKGSNACGSGPVRDLSVSVRNVPGQASSITGLSTVCTEAVNTGYYTSPLTGADYYIWTYPFGASGSSSTNTIMISYGSEPLTGQITVKGHNMCGDGMQSTLPVTVTTVPSAIGSISGLSDACRNQADVSYSVTAIPNATSYLWSLPKGVTGSNSTSSVILKFGPDAYSGDLKVSGVNSCGTGGEIVFPVTVNEAPAQLGSITGPVTVCRGQANVTYTVPLSERATSYKWELPDGSTEMTLTNKIVLNFTADAVSGNLFVTPQNSCGTGGGSNLYITVPVPVKPVISISDNYTAGACMSETPVKLSVNKVSGYTYQWYKNGIPLENAEQNYIEDFLPAGDYTVAADLNGCNVLSDNINLNYAASPDKPEIYAQGPTVWYLACSNISASGYKWYYNNQLIEGANKHFYLANYKLGKYQVSVSNDKGCFTRSDIITIPPGYTGIEDADPFMGLKIYPNPTPGLFTIEMDNNLFGELVIDIFTQEGRKILNIKFEKTTEHFKSQVDLSGQKKGMYVLNFLLDKFFASRKLLVE